MARRKFQIYFSDFFNVPTQTVSAYGAFDISLINDLPLFVDPFLFFNSEDEHYQKLHEEIIRYMVFLKAKSSEGLSAGLIKSWYHFPEVKQNWMGFSKSGNNGRGLGADFAKSLKRNLTTVFQDFGDEANTHTHLGKLTLIKNGVGKDQISDFTCNLIKGFLAEYTEKFAAEHIHPSKLQKFMVKNVEFNYDTETWKSKQYVLPRFGSDYVFLTPVDILTKDEAWISHKGFIEDFSAVMSSVDNEQLRDKMERYLAKKLPFEATREEREKAIEQVVLKYPELMDFYIKQREADAGEATSTSAEKVSAAQKLFVAQLTELVDTLDKHTKFYETTPSSYKAGMERVLFLKSVIEDQDGYRLFYIDGKPVSREADLQIMFKLTWFASTYSADAEVNNGRGPTDFLVSYGSATKTVIEFKLAKNSHLEKNLINQAEIYSKASKATHPPIKAILFFNLKELHKVQGLLLKHKLTKCKDIVLIDARKKESASKTDGSDLDDDEL